MVDHSSSWGLSVTNFDVHKSANFVKMQIFLLILIPPMDYENGMTFDVLPGQSQLFDTENRTFCEFSFPTWLMKWNFTNFQSFAVCVFFFSDSHVLLRSGKERKNNKINYYFSCWKCAAIRNELMLLYIASPILDNLSL